MAYGSFVLQRDLSFIVKRGDVFIVMGGSGCGKSTLMRHLVGLKEPARGRILYGGMSFWEAEPEERERMMRRIGIMYQSGALWSSMTLAENVAVPLEMYTSLKPAEIREVASLKLALVGLAGFEDAIHSAFPAATVQTCVVHLIRNALRPVARKDRDAVAKELRKI